MTFRWTIRIVSLVLTGALLVNACKKSTGDSNGLPHPLTFNIPPGFPAPAYDFSGNPLTEEGFALGRKLFYDGILSKDGNFPCASCHQQFAAFATYDHNLSHGFDNQFTTRNAPGLFNMAWQKNMHWDGGINNIEVQPLAPITAPNEMAEDIGNVINKLRARQDYPGMFKAAFGDTAINSQRLLLALTQFVGSIVSADSKYDRVKRGLTNFTAEELAGYNLFKAKCATCHKEPLFTDNSYRNNGLSYDPYLKDVGRMRITNNSGDSLKFKVPSLRNVLLTFPYMHDGRFYGISTVLDHYSGGIQAGPTLDPLLENGIPMSNVEKYYITQFLYTLTDSTLLKDARFAPPR